MMCPKKYHKMDMTEKQGKFIELENGTLYYIANYTHKYLGFLDDVHGLSVRENNRLGSSFIIEGEHIKITYLKKEFKNIKKKWD